MRPLPILLLALLGCGGERCLELLTEGIEPSPTDWLIAAGYPEGAPQPGLGMERRGAKLGPGNHEEVCFSPGTEDEAWRLDVWIDSGPADPFEGYCKELGPTCVPQPGQPRGSKAFNFPAHGRVTLTVPIGPAP